MDILLADDHELVRETLKFFLEKIEPECRVAEAANFSEAMKVADRANHLDLILLDLRMPGMNRFSGLDAMRQRYPKIPVVIISGFIGRDDVVDALHHGAAGVVPKTLGSKAMLGALRLVMSGETFVPALIEEEDPPFDGGTPADNSSTIGPTHKLTSREREVLQLLISGLTNKQIGKRLGIQEVTVKLHMRGIFRKFNAANRTQAVRIAIQNGWHL